MKRSLMAPRLSSLETFAGALLVALGVQAQAGCNMEVMVEGNGGGGTGGASSTHSSSSAASGEMTTSSGTSGTSGYIPGTGQCVDPKPVIVQGIDVGLDLCAAGQHRRRAAVDCPATPDPNSCCGTCPDGTMCRDSVPGVGPCICIPSCVKDSDCMAGEMCMCLPKGGYCIPAKCNTSADCAEGQECTSYDRTNGCMYFEFACTTAQDTCGGNPDCTGSQVGGFCAMQTDGHRDCQSLGCVQGRPFLIEGEARTADVQRREDWRDDAAPNIVGLDERVRTELAASWEHTARMEHASIAAFARFALELLSLGAPSDLIMRTNAALVDETNHARVAFAMASVYRGKPVGPGRLSIEGSMSEGDDVASIVRRVIREGCVGETVAAVEAGEAASRASDPVVRRALETIAADESAHAELAWRTVTWALETFGADVRGAIREEMARLEEELGRVHEARRTAWDEELLGHGVVTTNVGASIRRAVLKEVVVPCLGAMVAGAKRKEWIGEAASV